MESVDAPGRRDPGAPTLDGAPPQDYVFGMQNFDVLDLAAGEFARRLRAVKAEQWSRPTPCSEFNVRQLVEHVVAGNRMSAILLDGGSREQALVPFKIDVLESNPVEAFNGSYRTKFDRFKRPGALDKIVHHPMGDIPATMLLNFRIGDLTLHAWDLARAIGTDEQLNASLVQLVWDNLSPMGDAIASSGAFGAGPSGDVPATAPLQTRLLDLSGRRP